MRVWLTISGLVLAGVLCASLAVAQPSTTQRKVLIEGVTTNTASTSFTLPSGVKSILGEVVGTGAVTQTQTLYGDTDTNQATEGVILCTITLSGTTRDYAACPPFEGTFAFYYILTSDTTGTGATGGVYAMY